MRRLATLLVVGGLAAGCHEAAEPQPPSAPAPIHLKVSFRPVLSNALFLIAQGGGYFRRHGLDVELVEGGGGHNRDNFPLLVEGKLDALSSTVSPGYFNAMAAGADVRVVAELGRLARDGCTYAAFVTRREKLRDGHLVLPAPPRKLRLALRRGSASEMILDRVLTEERIGRDRYEIDFLASDVEAEALRSGSVDVVFGNAGASDRLLADPANALWRTAQSVVPDFPFLVLLYGPSLLRKDPDAGRRFVGALVDAIGQYDEGKSERNLGILEGRVGLDRATLSGACLLPVARDARPDTAGLLAFQHWAHAGGLLDRSLGLGEFWDPRFVDGASH